MFETKYPYTDFSQLNLDWFLSEFKKISDEVADLKATVEAFVIVGNPELEGTEPLLTGLQINENKFKAPDQVKLINNVAGTEPSLKGIQVGEGLIYKILPPVSSLDEGKFLRVDSSGQWDAEEVSSAEGEDF